MMTLAAIFRCSPNRRNDGRHDEARRRMRHALLLLLCVVALAGPSQSLSPSLSAIRTGRQSSPHSFRAIKTGDRMRSMVWLSSIDPSSLSSSLETNTTLNASSTPQSQPSSSSSSLLLQTPPLSLNDAIQSRYACTRYQRYDGVNETTTTATTGNPAVIEIARECLDLARRSPSGFNVQPYKLLLVSSPKQKERMARFCVGHNAHRVRDSDCTVIFLADRQSMQGWTHYQHQLLKNAKRTLTRWQRLKVCLLMGLFTQGLPYLPTILAAPISMAFCFAMRVVSWFTRGRIPVPTLTSAETWSQKNTMLVAMTYMLACSSRHLATTPMEGFTAWGIRQALKIPRRYTIPLIVATGRPFVRNTTDRHVQGNGKDDAGMVHGNTQDTATWRYPSETMIFDNEFELEGLDGAIL